MTPYDKLTEYGYCCFPEAIPQWLVRASTSELNANPDEFYSWTGLTATAMRRYIRLYMDFNGIRAYGDDDLQVFNRYVGSQMCWHDDEDGSNTPRIFVATYLTDTFCGCGALKFLPNSHKGGYCELLCRISAMKDAIHNGESKESVLALYPDLYRSQPNQRVYPMLPGTIFVGDRRLIHATEPNVGPERRTMVLLWQTLT